MTQRDGAYKKNYLKLMCKLVPGCIILALWHQMLTTVNTHCNVQKTKFQLKSQRILKYADHLNYGSFSEYHNHLNLASQG